MLSTSIKWIQNRIYKMKNTNEIYSFLSKWQKLPYGPGQRVEYKSVWYFHGLLFMLSTKDDAKVIE